MCEPSKQCALCPKSYCSEHAANNVVVRPDGICFCMVHDTADIVTRASHTLSAADQPFVVPVAEGILKSDILTAEKEMKKRKQLTYSVNGIHEKQKRPRNSTDSLTSSKNEKSAKVRKSHGIVKDIIIVKGHGSGSKRTPSPNQKPRNQKSALSARKCASSPKGRSPSRKSSPKLKVKLFPSFGDLKKKLL